MIRSLLTLWISGLLDPTHTMDNASESVVVSDKDPWNGALYCSFGEAQHLAGKKCDRMASSARPVDAASATH